ncbi:MAG: Mur ligase domain-containing protein, partial [Puniceicoccales bacterium]|nr:Mur ligase domain-containing protein [Puniceicoccales bacterium]
MPLPPKDGAYSSDFGTTILAFQKLFQQFTVFRDPMACTNVVYLVGLGGMGMTPLALYLQKRGFRVYGWDDGELKPETKEWFKHTVTVTPKIPEDCGSMVYSSAIAEEHPLRREALERLLPSFQRGTFLAQVLGDRKVIGVVGSHGKTTTTAWIIHFLKSQSRPFDYLLGGFFCREYWPADHHPDSTWAILEIDESDGTLLQFSPEYTVVLNDDWDHPTHYPTAQKYTDTLKALCRQTHTGIVLSSTLPWEKEIKKPCLTFGPKGNFSARRKGTLWHLKGPSTSMDYDVPPIFFPNNLLAAVATTVTLTGQWPTSEDLLTFPGVKRRQEILFQTPFLSVVTDYAHHPTELQTYLSFARKRRRGKHWAVFEPHRYSRTRTFLKDFIAPLNLPDKTMLLPIYGASEPNENALTSENIARHLSHHEPIDFLQIPHFIQRLSAEKVPLTLHLLGAGNIEKWGQSWLKDLREGWYSRLQKIVKRCQRNRE